MGRRLVDCQYFPLEDIAVIHEIIDGERNYQIFKNPDFHYFIEPELKKLKKETEYYKSIDRLRRVDCKYVNRYASVAIETNKEDELLNLDYEAKKRIMCNHNVYGADDQIEYRLIVDYFNKYKDEIDETIPLNYLFFDIEVHSDFNKKTYLELEKIFHYLEEGRPYIPDLNGIQLDHFKYIMDEEDIDKVKDKIKEFFDKAIKEKYFDIRLYVALANSNAMKKDPERVKNFLSKNLTKEKLDFIYDNIGFPDEEKANNRIDAISFVDVTKRKLYMYLLNIPNDLPNEEDRLYIKNQQLVENDLFKFIELFSIVSYLKNIDKAYEEVCRELLDELPYLNEMYHNIDIKNEEDRKKVNLLVEKAKSIIPDYENTVKVNVEYKLFDSELEMILDFFDKIKTEIKPSIIAAHNARFDINTIRNRLTKFGYDFNKLINQLTVFNDPDLNNIKSDIKIDMLTMERKKEKTRYFCPGIVMLDTLLMYAKTVSGEKNWALDSIAKEELKDSKIGYDFEIHEFYFRDIKRFIKYSAVDTLLLMRLEEQIKFIILFQLILSNSKTGWNSYMHRTTYLTNMIKFELTQRKDGHFVLRNNLTGLNPKKEKTQGSTKEVSYKGVNYTLHLYRNI